VLNGKTLTLHKSCFLIEISGFDEKAQFAIAIPHRGDLLGVVETLGELGSGNGAETWLEAVRTLADQKLCRAVHGEAEEEVL